jgi:hypothetical protein
MLKSSPKWWFLMGAYRGFLVAGFNPLEKLKVNGKEYPIYEMDNKKCLKPPTS